MKTKKWRKGASALILALGFTAFADVADAQFKVPILNRGAASRAEENDERPAPTNRRKNATRVQAERFWREVAGEATRAEESTGKRYLVNFIATSYYDYEANKEVAEPLLPYVVGSYCVSTLALNWCDVDETITISGKYLNKKQIDKVFDILAEKTEPNDEIFVYWNGHAGPVAFKDADGAVTRYDLGVKDEADGCDESLSLYECLKPVRNLEEAREQRMIDDDLATNFKKLNGRRVTAFFEVCHAAGLANPENLQVTGRPRTLQNGASRYSDGPELPCVDTWEKLKSEADSTGEWLSAENAQAALQFISWELRVDENGIATPVESDDATEENEEENDDATEENEESDDASLRSGAQLFDVLNERAKRGGKGVKRAKAEEIGPSLDLSTDTLDRLAVAFTCLENETSRAGLCTISDGRLGMRIVNPGAFALFLTIANARVNGQKATFADFRNALDHIVVTHNDLERELRRRNPELEQRLRDEIQTPAYLSNADGATIYDPRREN